MSRRQTRKTTEFGAVWDATDPVRMHERSGNLWPAWVAWMFALEDAEVCLSEREVHRKGPNGEVVMPMLLSVRAMLLGYALECGLKALWVKRGHTISRNGRYEGVRGANDHDLIQLAQATNFIPTPSERDVLKRLSKFVRFAGRYPVAKSSSPEVR